jgi:hypothetical protein
MIWSTKKKRSTNGFPLFSLTILLLEKISGIVRHHWKEIEKSETLACACCNWRQHLQRLSPHGLHWPTVDEGLDTAALTSVSLMLLGRRNATTCGSGNNLASVSLVMSAGRNT